jgi:hypothetical protein
MAISELDNQTRLLDDAARFVVSHQIPDNTLPTLMRKVSALLYVDVDAVNYLLLNLRITQQCGNPVVVMLPGVYQCLSDARRERDSGKIQIYTTFLEMTHSAIP